MSDSNRCRRKRNYIAAVIGWLLGSGSSTTSTCSVAFVPVNDLTSPRRRKLFTSSSSSSSRQPNIVQRGKNNVRRNNNKRKHYSAGLQYGVPSGNGSVPNSFPLLMAVALDPPKIVNRTEQEDPLYFVDSSKKNENAILHEDVPLISKGNGVRLFGFEEQEYKILNGATENPEVNDELQEKQQQPPDTPTENPLEILIRAIDNEDIKEAVSESVDTVGDSLERSSEVFSDTIEYIYDSNLGEEGNNNNSEQPASLIYDDPEMDDAYDDEIGSEGETIPMSTLWRKRHARTVEEGVRKRVTKLSSLLNRAKADVTGNEEKRYVERIIMGLINAVAEEIEDLDVDLTTNPKTPLWRKEVKELRINFSRLGFKPLRMGGSNMPDQQIRVGESETANLSFIDCADEAFDTIDKDNSGTLDCEEIAEALAMISADKGDKDSLAELASELVELYDTNSDGVVDREEYQLMIEDMASLRPKRENPLKTVRRSVESISKGISEKAAQVASAARRKASQEEDEPEDELDVPAENELGSIVLSDLNLDLRRLAFGGIPLVKKVTPGGPLILEPFTAIVTGSFSREDVMGSFLLDSGLRLLVARVLRVRLRSYRDFTDGAFFFGRQWKMNSKNAPEVEVLGLSNVEFDSQDKLIVTGRARIRSGPGAPVITNTFKVRTKIGTGKRGQTIRLVEPELAFVFECPRVFENGLSAVCKTLGMPPPKRPEPFYSFFPIYSPLKVTDENAGFDMGDDNKLRQIFIKDGKLRIQMSAVLRPGRFLGSHYIAFTLPQRTFIITMDRVREGARTARKNKKIAAREKQISQKANQDLSSSNEYSVEKAAAALPTKQREGAGRRIKKFFGRNKIQKPTKSFFSRFVEGYTLVGREGDAKSEQVANDISDFFGRLGSSTADATNAIIDETYSDEA